MTKNFHWESLTIETSIPLLTHVSATSDKKHLDISGKQSRGDDACSRHPVYQPTICSICTEANIHDISDPEKLEELTAAILLTTISKLHENG